MIFYILFSYLLLQLTYDEEGCRRFPCSWKSENEHVRRSRADERVSEIYTYLCDLIVPEKYAMRRPCRQKSIPVLEYPETPLKYCEWLTSRFRYFLLKGNFASYLNFIYLLFLSSTHSTSTSSPPPSPSILTPLLNALAALR